MRLIYIALVGSVLLCGCANQTARVDPLARAEYDKVEAKLSKLKTVELDVLFRDHETEDARYSVQFKDKDHFRAQDGSQSIIADGESVFSVDSASKTYERAAIGQNLQSEFGDLWGLPSMEPASFKKSAPVFSYIKKNGERLLRKHLEFDGDQLDVFFSLETGLPLGYRHEVASDMGGSQLIEAEYSNIKLNPALKPELFAFHKPSGFRIASDRLQYVQMKVGSTFPSANLSFVDSRYRSVAQMAKENKAVLVIFWSHG